MHTFHKPEPNSCNVTMYYFIIDKKQQHVHVCTICLVWKEIKSVHTHIFCKLLRELNNPSGRSVSLLEDKFLQNWKQNIKSLE